MGTRRWYRDASVTLVALAAAGLFAGACGDDDDDDGGGNGPPDGVPGSGIDPDPLNLEIQAATIPAAPGGRPTVTFRLTDGNGAPVDVTAEVGNLVATPRVAPNVSPRFTLAMLEDDGDYLSYYENPEASPAAGYTVPADLPLPPGNAPGPLTQATATPGLTGTNFVPTDLVSRGGGVYELTLPAPMTEVAGLDPTKTHTIAGWVVRSHPSGDTDIAYASFNFVPTGGAAVQLDQTVTDASCNKCHGQLQAHGTRRGTQLCMTCHSPQTGDPETGRTVDFKVMVHKIHSGRNLPSVAPLALDPPGEGFPYYIVGNRGSIHDYSDAAFPWHDGVSHCTACHEGEDQDNWRTKPTLAACTSCHDNVRFDGSGIRNCDFADDPANPASGNWYDACNHPDVSSLGDVNGPTICATCHNASSPALAVDNPAFHHGSQGP